TVDLAVLNGSATLTILELDRAASTRSHYVFHRVWREVESVVRFDPDFNATHPWYTNASQEELGADGNPFIAHLDGEPGGVVLSQSDGLPGHFAFDGDGTLRWWTAFWDGNAGPWAGRLRPNEPVRAVFATDGGQVVAYDVASGAIQWTFDVAAYGVVPGSISVAPNVFDLRGDGRMSVFVGARQAVNDTGVGEDPGTWMHRQHAKYFLLSSGGQELWSASLDLGNPMAYMHPAAVDLNGDGVKDLVVLDWNTIGHHPGNWEKLGPANLFALDGATGETHGRALALQLAGGIPAMGPRAGRRLAHHARPGPCRHGRRRQGRSHPPRGPGGAQLCGRRLGLRQRPHPALPAHRRRLPAGCPPRVRHGRPGRERHVLWGFPLRLEGHRSPAGRARLGQWVGRRGLLRALTPGPVGR
ncbi:MAG: VCBS repeat-containing protein, partial [Halobacteriales archaeon]|nr:VCBS repeat-containing protein [Halobacteriales archaeon]